MTGVSELPCCSPQISAENVDGKVSVFSQRLKKSFVIGEAEYNVLVNLDGLHDYEQLSKISGKYNAEQIKTLVGYFSKMGLLDDDTKEETDGKGRFNIFKRRKLGIINGSKWINPDGFFTKIFNFILLYLTLPIFAYGIVLYYLNTDGFKEVRVKEVLTMSPLMHIVCFIITASLHELAHAVIARRNRIPVPEIGIMLYMFMPYVYTNLSYIRLLKSKRKRMLCLAGGIMLNLLLSGIFFTLAVYTPLEHRLVFEEIAFMNIILVISNMMVFFKLDGYFMLQEILDETYLREKSIDSVREIIGGFIGKMSAQKENKNALYSYKNTKNDAFYVAFGLLSIGYTPVMLLTFATGVIGYFI